MALAYKGLTVFHGKVTHGPIRHVRNESNAMIGIFVRVSFRQCIHDVDDIGNNGTGGSFTRPISTWFHVKEGINDLVVVVVSVPILVLGVIIVLGPHAVWQGKERLRVQLCFQLLCRAL